MGGDGLKHRGIYGKGIEARELLELGDAIRMDETSTDRDSKFFRKPIGESVIAKEVAEPGEPGQVRLIEQTFDLVKPLAELDETIKRTREALNLPTKEKKRQLRILLSIRDSIEPSCGEINYEQTGGMLKILHELLKRRVAGARDGRVITRPCVRRIEI